MAPKALLSSPGRCSLRKESCHSTKGANFSYNIVLKLRFARLDSALFRQAVYGTARLGIFKSITENYQKKHNSDQNFLESV